MFRVLRISERVMHLNADSKILKFPNDFDHFGIAKIRTILFEREAQHCHGAIENSVSRAHHFFHGLLSDESSHAVVDAAASEYHLRDVSGLLWLVRQVIRIDTDAVSADESWTEFQEIPFRARGFENFIGIDSEPVKDDCELVHQCDVQVALRILDDLSGFSDLD